MWFFSPFFISIVCSVSCSVVHDSLQPSGWKPTRLLCPWNSSGKNTAVGSHSLSKAIFSTQGPNLGLLHCRKMLFHLSHQGSPFNYNFIPSTLCVCVCVCVCVFWQKWRLKKYRTKWVKSTGPILTVLVMCKSPTLSNPQFLISAMEDLSE